MQRRAIFGALGLIVGSCFIATSALAQASYPTKPVRLVVPFPPGGSADLVARSIAAKFTENTKQPMLVDNKPGADTIIGMEIVKSAPPDGYTVGYSIGSALTMNPVLYSKLPYDPKKDFAPVSVIAEIPLALVVTPSVPANSVAELAALIKSKPGELFYGQANIVSKIATEAFLQAVGGKMTEVAYKGSAPAIQALLADEVKLAIEPFVGIIPYAQSGKLKILAATGARRSTVFPTIPTVAESGVAGYSFDAWHAVVAPANTPRDVVLKLNAELVKAARHPDVVKSLANLGIEVVAGTPEELDARVTAERDVWTQKIRAMGIKLD